MFYLVFLKKMRAWSFLVHHFADVTNFRISKYCNRDFTWNTPGLSYLSSASVVSFPVTDFFFFPSFAMSSDVVLSSEASISSCHV